MSELPASKDTGYRKAVQIQVAELVRTKPYHSLELPDGTRIPGLIPIESLEKRVRSFAIPESLSGRRVLDVGAATGWNSFEMARRGAEVMAIDCVEFPDFRAAQKFYNPRVDYRILDVDELDPVKSALSIMCCSSGFSIIFGIRFYLSKQFVR